MVRTVSLRYTCAVASIVVAIVARRLLDPLIGPQYLFATLCFAVMFTVWYGGLRPALTASVLGAAGAALFLLPPHESFHLPNTEQLYGIVLYLITAVGISFLGGYLQSGHRQAEQQSQILDMANDTIVIRDQKDRIAYWNEGATKLYGYTRAEAMGQVSHVLLATEFPERMETIRSQVLTEGSWKGELVHRRKDGGKVTVSSSWTLRRDGSGRPVSIVEMNFDITARKRAEREKDKSRLQLNAVVRNSREGIVVFEAVRDTRGKLEDLTFAMVNPAAEKMLRMNARDLIDWRLTKTFPSVLTNGLFEKFANTITNDADFELDYKGQPENSQDGKTQWFRITSSKMGDGLVVRYSDITAKKLAEDQRQLLMDRLGAAAGVLRTAVWDWNLATQAIQWDEKMYEIYGLAADAPVDYDTWAKSVLPEDLPAAEARLRNAVETKSRDEMEFRIRVPDGSIRHLRAAFATVLDDSGEVARVVGVNIDLTERRRSEERFRMVVEAAPNAMVLVDADGLMTLVNTQAEKLFGYHRRDLLGKPVETLLPSWQTQDTNRWKDLYIVCADGREIAVEVGLNPIETDEGRCVLASVVNVTERSKVEGYVKLLSTLIESAKDYAIFMLDAEGCVLTWNEGAERINGYTKDEIVGKPFSCFYTGKDLKAGVPEQTLATARTAGRFENEGWRVRKDGSIFWAGTLITAVFNQRGELRGFSEITRDRTEQRITDERFQTVVEASPSALVMVDSRGKIMLVNRQAERLLGFERSELLGKSLEMLVPPRFRATHEDHRRAYSHSPMTRAMGAGAELYALRKDGSEVPVEIGLNPITTTEGDFVLASIIDVTERRRYENELRTKATEMERFTYTVSHDLKSPLITIKSFISMIEMDMAAGNPERIGKDLQRVSKAADRMQVLLEEVLTLSRVGRVENAPETIAFASLVEEALELVAGRIAARNIRVEVDANLPFVTVRRHRMVEALQNLIDNATKFMAGQAAPEIRIGVRRDGYSMRFYVKDNGSGIDPKHHERIFGLFDKLDPKSEGSGAGLAIVKRIIEVHGGRIWVESNGRDGSTFWFTLDEHLPGENKNGIANASFVGGRR